VHFSGCTDVAGRLPFKFKTSRWSSWPIDFGRPCGHTIGKIAGTLQSERSQDIDSNVQSIIMLDLRGRQTNAQ